MSWELCHKAMAMIRKYENEPIDINQGDSDNGRFIDCSETRVQCGCDSDGCLDNHSRDSILVEKKITR